MPLAEIIKKQTTTIQAQIEGLNQAKTMCERMLESGNISFDELQVEKYVADLESYWSNNKSVFKLDSVSFLYIWGSLITWTIITVLCLIIGILSYGKLPAEIPVQWDNGFVTSAADKKFIFVWLTKNSTPVHNFCRDVKEKLRYADHFASINAVRQYGI